MKENNRFELACSSLNGRKSEKPTQEGDKLGDATYF